ncbi:MAG TPA: exonuclease [Pilimelia sp.]|nr:exonuclease [Pilimelia sp.]
MARPEIYVSTDVETDGPIPGPHSMLSFASAAYTAGKDLVGTFSANLATLPGADGHPDTMAWWATQPAAWAACRADPDDPAAAMARYREWLSRLPGRPVFVGYPAAFDFMFVYWYLIRFTGSSPFSHAALDIKTYAMAVLGSDYRATVKRAMPRNWFDDIPHSHVALDDAREQGALFCAMLAASRQSRTAEPNSGD